MLSHRPIPNDSPSPSSAPPTGKPGLSAPSSGAPAQETREDPVLQAAYDSILEVGVRRTTLADVARRAGVSRMTVYRKYDDLPRLLSALLTVELSALLREVDGHTSGLTTVRARTATMVARASQALAGHPILARVLAVDPEALLPLIVDRLGSIQRLALEQLATSIEAGQSPNGDGSVRAGDPSLLALMIMTSTQSLVFSSRAISSADPLGLIYDELGTMTNAYLNPEISR
ncbi:MAG: TetR/AcrR family transcriptional regulator [Actinobacteria bacterium]|nr:TetR/AcrR family transcriptional regulator [Actinomycetota bacterium]